MSKRIVIIDGHPDADRARFIHALAEAYRVGAEQGGHEVRLIRLATMDFPLLQSNEEFLKASPPRVVKCAQDDIDWSNHLVILYPLWLGDMPALLKGFLEQVMRPGFAYNAQSAGGLPKKRLTGKSAHIFVTMGMPSLFYRWYFRAHSVKSLERNVLRFVGIKPVSVSIIGSLGAAGMRQRTNWLNKVRVLGRLAK